MKYISFAEAAKRFGVSQRSVRGRCADGKIADSLAAPLKAEKAFKVSGGIYHKVQIELTYNFQPF